MRLSTAVTLALIALLVTPAVGAVAAVPSDSGFVSEPNPDVGSELDPVPAPAPDSALSPTVTERSPSTLSETGTADAMSSPRIQADTVASDREPLEPADPGQIIRLSVRDDGDVNWSIESRFLLVGEEDEETFQEHAQAVVSGQRGVGYDIQSFETALEAAEAETDRDMEIVDAGWDEPRTEPYEPVEGGGDDALFGTGNSENETVKVGIISYSLTWENFATVDDERVYFGDAFQSPQGTWFPSLTDDQRLVVESPPGYALETPTNLTWDGPHQFEDGELEIVFVRGPSTSTGAWLDWSVAGGLLIAIVGAVGGYALYRYAGGDGDGSPLERLPVVGGAESDGGAVADSRRSDTADDPTEAASVDAATREPDTQFQYEEDIDDDIDPELLADEERVHRLLKQNGGRMKQANIVTETGWSNAKVSQLLSQMDEDGEIEKLRIGRENLITLPDVDPTEID